MSVVAGQVWEMYSRHEHGWVPMIVIKVEDDLVTIRPQGILELITVASKEMLDNPERFRLPVDAN